MLTEKDPKYLPWCYLNIDLVLECTGLLIKEEDARKHIMAGDKKVLISALGKEWKIKISPKIQISLSIVPPKFLLNFWRNLYRFLQILKFL